MGKGFNNYMCKKFFHPASRDNLKRVWMAEQKAEAYKKKQEELKTQYEKEQDLYTNKAMLSKDSKDKLSVNFMYEPPPGAKKEREREDNEPEYKFEWQRKYNAPRESYCKGDSEIRDQPFGIQVRNVRCIKCHKWGHINTDKECPLFKEGTKDNLGLDPLNKPKDDLSDPLVLVKQMREDGLHLKTSALALQHHVDMLGGRAMIPEPDSDEEMLKGLTKDQKQRLLKKLKKLAKKEKFKKRRRLHKKKKSSRDSDESESSDSEDDRKKRRNEEKKDKKNSSKRKSSSDNDSERKKSKKRKKSRKSNSSNDSSSDIEWEERKL